MMASGREKREKTGEKLKDIIESLKGPKATKTDIETSNDSAFLPRFFFVVPLSYAPFLNVAILFLSPVSHLNYLECHLWRLLILVVQSNLAFMCIISQAGSIQAPFCFLLHFNFYKHGKHI
jgi:hypothetical protein